MKSAKRKRCSTSDNQEVATLSKQQLPLSGKSADPNEYYLNQGMALAAFAHNSRMSALAMPPPPAPPPPPFDYINYNAYLQNMYASNANLPAATSHQSYLSYNQFLINSNNNNQNAGLASSTASGYRKHNTTTADKTGEAYASELDAENNSKVSFWILLVIREYFKDRNVNLS